MCLMNIFNTQINQSVSRLVFAQVLVFACVRVACVACELAIAMKRPMKQK